jgi:hypothetical protein
MYKHQDLNIYIDCSALSVRGRCARLTLPMCQGVECTFKRNVEEDIDSLELAYRRLSNLDMDMQIKIAKKYYSGSMPWSETKTV